MANDKKDKHKGHAQAAIRAADATIPVASAQAALHAHGDVTITQGASTRDAVQAGGSIHIGRGAHVAGALTAVNDIEAEDGTRVDGPVEVGGTLRCGRGVSLAGVTTRGPLITSDGITRAAYVVARHGLEIDSGEGAASMSPKRREG